MMPLASREIARLASEPAVHRAFRWFHLHELQLRQWQKEFLAIAAPTFQEAARGDWFCRRFQALGLQGAHMDAAGNAVCALGMRTQTAGPCVLLSAHLDTVFSGDVPCSPRDEGSRIVCPGACDNGAGLAALLALAAAMQDANMQLPCPVILAANVGEEGEGDLSGMRHLFEQPPFSATFQAAIALEGAGNALVVDRALGSRRLRVHLRGPGGHSWADSQRPNPLLALSAALLAVARLPLPAQPRTTLNVGMLHGGTSVNSVPELATAHLDLRSTSEEELDRLEARVLATLSAEVHAEVRTEVKPREEPDRLLLSVERIGARPVGALPPGSALYQAVRTVDRHLGIATDSRIGSTDANLPLARGVPALALGAGGTASGLHTTGEWYDPTGRDLALRRILLLLLHTCHWIAKGTPEAVGA